MAQVLIQKQRHKIKSIFGIIKNPARIEVLKALQWNDLSYKEINKIIFKTLGTNTRNICAFHVRELQNYNLMVKNAHNGLYHITVKGLRILGGIRQIEESEMFI